MNQPDPVSVRAEPVEGHPSSELHGASVSRPGSNLPAIPISFSLADRPTTEQLRAELERISNRRTGRTALRVFLILLAVLAVLAVASVFLFPAFVIYGNSMAPALQEGDLVLAAPGTLPEIGDTVAFRSGERILIKRVVACPGDSVTVHEDGSVSVNGRKLDEPWAVLADGAAGELDYPVMLPDSGYFVLGDNRGASVDSRNRVLGVIDRSQLQGRLVVRLWPLNRVGALVDNAFPSMLQSLKLRLHG